MKMLASFSGGKDSMLSLDRAIEQGNEIGVVCDSRRRWEFLVSRYKQRCARAVSMSLGMPLFLCPCRQGEGYTGYRDT